MVRRAFLSLIPGSYEGGRPVRRKARETRCVAPPAPWREPSCRRRRVRLPVTPEAHLPHSAAPAYAGTIRGRPGLAPLLPAPTRSLRAASEFLTSPPPRGDPRVRSGTLRLYSHSKEE